MNIAISLNHKFVKYAYVMLSSLYKNNPEEPITVYALNRDLTAEDKQLLCRQAEAEGNTVCPVDIDETKYSEKLPLNEQWSVEIYFRLQMMDLLPEEVDRILYLDVDTIILHSLKELYETDFEGKLFCVCKDHGVNGSFPDQIRNELFVEHFQKGMVYFNSGVMLWNLKELRGRVHLETYLNMAEQLHYRILAPDQDLLNYIHFQEVKLVDEYRYNVFALLANTSGVTYEEALAGITILHYTGFKPWEGEALHYELEKIWWDYAKQTPFYLEFVETFMNQLFTAGTKMRDQQMKNFTEKKEIMQELQNAKLLIQKLSLFV